MLSVLVLSVVASGARQARGQDPESLLAGGGIYLSGAQSYSSLLDSVTGNLGLIAVNQNSGSMNNQLNSVLACIDLSPEVHAVHTAARQGNSAQLQNTGSISMIDGSLNESDGVFLVNQASGNLNIEQNHLYLLMGKKNAVPDAELGETTSNLQFTAVGTVSIDGIKDSVKGCRGIGVITQSSGNLNTVTTSVAVNISR
ncbi:MAG: hypothetical protein M0Z75_14385 [Nitrospiraceae bacterium]|nr:hypothetical protein [Nitrospiraceae bacterium]